MWCSQNSCTCSNQEPYPTAKTLWLAWGKWTLWLLHCFQKEKKRKITGVVHSPRRAASPFDPCNGRPNPHPKTLLICFPVLWLSPHFHWFQLICLYQRFSHWYLVFITSRISFVASITRQPLEKCILHFCLLSVLNFLCITNLPFAQLWPWNMLWCFIGSGRSW